MGADAVLSVTGYYNKPSQEGMYRHFMAIADAVDIPILLYNIPGRAIVEISVETMARLAKHPNIIGVKDATANLMRPSRERLACGTGLAAAVGRGRHGAGLHGPWRPWLHLGHRQCRAAACAPSSRTPACKAPSTRRARIQDKLMPLHDAHVLRAQPGAGEICRLAAGPCASAEVRLPLVEATDAARAQVKAAMQGPAAADRPA